MYFLFLFFFHGFVCLMLRDVPSSFLLLMQLEHTIVTSVLEMSNYLGISFYIGGMPVATISFVCALNI